MSDHRDHSQRQFSFHQATNGCPAGLPWRKITFAEEMCLSETPSIFVRPREKQQIFHRVKLLERTQLISCAHCLSCRRYISPSPLMFAGTQGLPSLLGYWMDYHGQ